MSRPPIPLERCVAALKAGEFLPVNNTLVMWPADPDRRIEVTYSFRDNTFRIARRRMPKGRDTFWELVHP